MLDINNEVDQYALHFVFLPIIQIQLDIFKEGWANHPLRTENNKTPLQLWIIGLHIMNSINPNSTEVAGINEVCFELVLSCKHNCFFLLCRPSQMTMVLIGKAQSQ